MLDHLMMLCTGLAYQDNQPICDVVEVMLECFPNVRRVVDPEHNREWEGETMGELVSALRSSWLTDRYY